MSDFRAGEKGRANTTYKTIAASRLNLNPALGLLVVITVLYFGREVFIPIALSLLLSFLLAPPILRLQRLGLGKIFPALLVVILLFAAIAFTSWVVMGQAFNLITDLPQYRQNIHNKLSSLTPRSLSKWERTNQMLADLGHDLVKQNPLSAVETAPKLPRGQTSQTQQPIPVQIREPDLTPFQFLENSAASVVQPLATAFIVVIFAIFILLGREDLRDRVLRLAGRSRLHITTQALDDAARRVSRYLLMQSAINVMFGTLVGLGLLLIGVPHPFVWAIAAAVLRFVPYIGVWIAALGPLLLAVAVAPGWGKFAWTFGLYVVLELIAGNVAEPLLYGASTGISAMAILVAAVFWTWLWGPIGLLLSTPLTVCVVVIGRYVPHLEFLGILFGDEPVLSPAQRFYQRMIAMDAEEAADLTEHLLKDKSLSDVYDEVIIPALSLAEEGRYAGFLDAAVEEYFLENTRQLVEDLSSQFRKQPGRSIVPAKLICLPAKDATDEVAARMFVQLLPATVVAEVLPFGISMEDLAARISTQRPNIVCVSGVPPQKMRQVALHCKHLRRQFPELTIMAALWSMADLASVRSRIPVTDASHVVCTMHQALDYIVPIVNPVASPETSEPETDEQPGIVESDLLGNPDSPLQDVLDRVTRKAAQVLNAPIAVLSLVDEQGNSWNSESGLPADLDPASIAPTSADLRAAGRSMIVIDDTRQDHRLAANPFLLEKGIPFFACVPLIHQNGKTVGCLCLLDTRPHRAGDLEIERLQLAAGAAIHALELRTVAPPSQPAEQAVHSD